MSSRLTHVGCPTQPAGPVFVKRHKLERTRRVLYPVDPIS
jgi:hypothetical protein